MSIDWITKALGVVKSIVYYKSKISQKRERTYRTPSSQAAKSAILEVTVKKSTNGIPRVKAILKRDRQLEWFKYMVQRRMKEDY